MVAYMNLVLNVILHVHVLYVDVSTKVISVYTSESMKESILSLEDVFFLFYAHNRGKDWLRYNTKCQRVNMHTNSIPPPSVG